MVNANPPSEASIKAWENARPVYGHFIRLFRVLYSLVLLTFQLPLVALDSLLGLSLYGKPSWSFKSRLFIKLISYLLWSTNPAGPQPLKNVLSYEVRKNPGKLVKGRHASLVEIEPRPDKLAGDALYPGVLPERCPCFWQWNSSMISPLSDSSPVVDRKAMVYLVGGGMIQGHPTEHPLPWNIMEQTKVPIFGVNFRKCVIAKTAFPAALQDAVAAFFYLLDRGYSAENICVMGDSGGGGIAITLLLYLRRQGYRLPGSAILISPFIDLVDKFSDNKERLDLDILNPEMCGVAQYCYTQNRPDLRATLLSPNRGDLPAGYTFEGFPTTLLNYGDVEMFTSSILQFVEHLRKAGVRVEVSVGEDQIHDYPLFYKDRSSGAFYDRLSPFLAGDGKY